MRPQFLHAITVFILFNLSSAAMHGQDPALSDTARAVLQSIQVTDIVIQSTQVNTLLREKRTHLLSATRKEEIASRMDTLLFRLALLREDPRIHNIDQLNLRSLENLQSDWSLLDNLFDVEQETLNEYLQNIEGHRSELAGLMSLWTLTSETVDKETTAELVLSQIDSTLDDIRRTNTRFDSDSKFIQEELVEISSGVIFTNEVLEKIILAKQEVTKTLLSLSSPPIWKEISRKKDTTIVFRQQRSLLDDSVTGVKDFYSRYSHRLWLHFVLTVMIIIIVYIIFSNLRHTLPETDSPGAHAIKNITKQPLASGWLVSLLLAFILYTNLPESVILLISLLLFPPMIIILRAVITTNARKYIMLPLIAIIMVELHSIGYSETMFSRFWLMFIILYGLFTLALIFGRKSQREVIIRKRYGKLITAAGVAGFIMLSIAFFANIIGAIALSEFLTHSVIESVTVALFLYACAAILNSIATTLVYSDYIKKSSILSQYQGLIHKRFIGLINLLAAILLINLTLRIFNIWDPVWGGIKHVITYNIHVGTMEFSLWNLALFFLIIWVTIWISRLVRTVFEGEAGLRDRMRRGVPGAVSLILRITIFTIGFMLAVAAAGVKMDKLAILLGAFGVGIGFGLQNIFNNLVSGIILAFERPIKEGDIIEVGSFLGIVKEIGIRSSIIRTYDGSEVVLPNGNLISNELINWTRTDMRRRGEVRVGVKYGTDPQKVIDLLTEVAGTHEQVLSQPTPVTLFLGFGDSSLDFRVLFWIGDADLRYVVQSEVAVMVNRAIVDSGIEIPFPQRDLHVRSVDPNLLDRVRAQDAIQSKQKKVPPPDKD
jgi:small-conductance mechanosensitive channel